MTDTSKGRFQLRVLVFSAIAHSVLAGSNTPWNKHEYEYDFVEAVLLIILVFIALGFEILVHHVWEEANHSYHYGKIHDEVNNNVEEAHKKDAHGNIRHAQLIKCLVHRMSGEFMTLGVLALTIFVLNQCEFFEFLAEALEPCGTPDDYRRLDADGTDAGIVDADCFHLPRTGADWLHAAEVVHVKLFLAMIFYFILVSRIVFRSNRFIKKWERLRLRHLTQEEQFADSPITSASSLHGAMKHDDQLENYKDMRDYLIRNVLLWKDSQKTLSRKLLRRQSIKGLSRSQQMATLKEEIDKRLSLAAYLSLNVENGVIDSIQVHVSTWGTIIMIFLASALCSRYAKLEIGHVVPFFIFISIFHVLFMVFINRTQTRAIKEFAIAAKEDDEQPDIETAVSFNTHVDMQTPPSSPQIAGRPHARTRKETLTEIKLDHLEKRNWYHRYMKEARALRVLQIVMFFLAYALAETIADKHKWKYYFTTNMIYSLSYLVMFMVLGWIVPYQVPHFLQVTSLPPFVHKANLEVFLHVLVDDHAIKVKKTLIPEHRQSSLIQAMRQTSNNSSSNPQDLMAVMELADVIQSCGDFDALSGVRSQLEERLRSLGIYRDDAKGEDAFVWNENDFAVNSKDMVSPCAPPVAKEMKIGNSVQPRTPASPSEHIGAKGEDVMRPYRSASNFSSPSFLAADAKKQWKKLPEDDDGMSV